MRVFSNSLSMLFPFLGAIIRGGKLLADGDIETVKGTESLEEVFLELVDDIKVEEDVAQEGERHA